MSESQRILVTGANGLLGRHAVATLRETHEVHAMVHTLPQDALDGVIYHVLDLASDWSTAALPSKIDSVFHLAQSSRFREFPELALDVFRVNVDSTARLLDYARRAGAKRFVFASSGGVYGAGAQAFTENSPIIPHGKLGYYLASKLCSEVLVQNYAQLMGVTILRFFFVYGAGQKRSMLIPRLVDNIFEGRAITLQGNDGIRINPIHVSDAVRSLQSCLELEGSHTFNVAGPDVLSLRELAELIGQAVGKAPVFNCEEVEPKHLVADIEEMQLKLVKPQVGFAEGLKELL